jgi:hypothetical protein
MDLSKISKNDWIVVGGFVLMLIAVSLKWYGWGLGILGISANVTGWHFFVTGVIPWFLTLVAAALVLVKGVSGLDIKLPVPEAMSVMALGGGAFVLVLIRLIKSPISGLSGTGIGTSRGIGLFLALIAAAVVAGGGFLKNSETAS